MQFPDESVGTRNCNNMNFGMTIEWDPTIGISSLNMLDFLDKIKVSFLSKNYGTGIDQIFTIVIYRPVHLKQRKRYKRAKRFFTYDIILDYYLIKNIPLPKKRDLIRSQIIEITNETINGVDFVDFDKESFLKDFAEIVTTAEWPAEA